MYGQNQHPLGASLSVCVAAPLDAICVAILVNPVLTRGLHDLMQSILGIWQIPVKLLLLTVVYSDRIMGICMQCGCHSSGAC